MHKNHTRPKNYKYILAPFPLPISTISLGEIFGWFFEGEYLPQDRDVHPLAKISRTDPNYTFIYPDGSCASEREVGHSLYVLCRLIQPQNVIEIGCYHGATSICIAAALDANGFGQLYCIDINIQNINFATNNISNAGLSHRVTFIHCDSQKDDTSHVAQASLIFIDADHTYEGVKSDFIKYKQSLTPSGIMVLHDSVKHMDIRRLLNEIVDENEYDVFTIATSDGDGMSLLRLKQ